MLFPSSLRPTWAEINLDHLAYNLNSFRDAVGKSVKIMSVVKADGYGHGAVEVARAAVQNGCDYLGVGFIDEGMELRRAGIEAPILILGYTHPQQAGELLDQRLIPTIFHLDLAWALSREALRRSETAKVHVKVDTGMGRLGICSREDLTIFIDELNQIPSVEIEGFYTHFAAADDRDKTYTMQQMSRFEEMMQLFSGKGIEVPVWHAANSAAAIDLPESHFNMIRLGISLYGLYPSQDVQREKVPLKPVMSLKTRVIFLKKVPPGTAISYGSIFVTQEDCWIASLPLGYGDGYSRLLSGKAQVLIKGKRFPVVGRICMDHMMVNLGSEDPKIQKGEEVVVLGRQGEEVITAEEIAHWLGTINYEVTCAISKRVPRVYLEKGRVKCTRTLLGNIES
ncbi:alanine racemase [Candidatus Contubernalis alkaliaceticus]|uniref:alanine racemase n=1 Tax=Candidatus Contubernalis alkaliaceticus TaxID=338645 RepID=UPI001F4C4722|nr:alanine racemase [Candidatus Contubernalis alkalaceticus]UNC91434.1 alanine racemase [Candidatus Contubernalis alkalaceticus]